jgi:hypothetical protein
MAILKPTLGIFTGTQNLGTVILEQRQLNTKFTDFTLPLSPEAGNSAINWKGRVGTIIIQGFHDGDGFPGTDANEKLDSFIKDIEEWILATVTTLNIQEKTTFTDSFGNSRNVYCYDWTWARSVTDPYRINYSLLLKVA